MFGENLTVSGFNEKNIYVGAVYEIGDALVQITQPREPCFKFGIKFETQKILKEFIAYGFPGTYVRVLKEGLVKNGDPIKLVKQAENSLSTWQLFDLLYSKNKNEALIKLAVEHEALPLRKREEIKKLIK